MMTHQFVKMSVSGCWPVDRAATTDFPSPCSMARHCVGVHVCVSFGRFEAVGWGMWLRHVYGAMGIRICVG